MSALRKPITDLLFTIDDLARMPEDGKLNEQRDRNTKFKLYSLCGVRGYWIVDWQSEHVEIYRRSRAKLVQTATLLRDDQLTSPLLPGFSCQVSKLFHQIPKSKA